MPTARAISGRLAGIALAAGLALAACAPPPSSAPAPVGSRADEEPRVHEVRVLSNGWHTAILVDRAAAASTGLLPEAQDFPDAALLEFGWGDREYFPAKNKTLGLALGAVLGESPAVMHVAGRAVPPGRDTKPDVATLTLTETDFQALIRAIDGDFERPEGGRAEPVAKGLYADSHFYHARGAFHMFNTCNTWTARMLRAGGVAVSPSGVVTADDLMSRLRAALAANPELGGRPRP